MANLTNQYLTYTLGNHTTMYCRVTQGQVFLNQLDIPQAENTLSYYCRLQVKEFLLATNSYWASSSPRMKFCGNLIFKRSMVAHSPLSFPPALCPVQQSFSNLGKNHHCCLSETLRSLRSLHFIHFTSLFYCKKLFCFGCKRYSATKNIAKNWSRSFLNAKVK